MEWMRNKSTGDVSESSHELPCLSKEEELHEHRAFFEVSFIKSGKDWTGKLSGVVSGKAWSQTAPVGRWQWDLCGGRAGDFAEQTLVRICTRLTTWHQKFHLLQEIAEKLFKPWVSVRLWASMAFSYRHCWKVRNDTYPQEEQLCKETQRENWNIFFSHI